MAEEKDRGPMRVNPVTGKMERVVKKKGSGEEMVREGCMMIPKKYLTAATDAGLGGRDGMYSNMSGVRRELNSGNNTGKVPSTGRKKPASIGRSVVSKGGNMHGFGSSSSSGPAPAPRKSNIKHCVQGRSRSVKNSSTDKSNDSSYSRTKGVVNGLGGCSSAKGRASAAKKRTGIAQISTGSGGRSFVKVADKGTAKGGGGGGLGNRSKPAAASKAKSIAAPAREGITRKLGGGSKNKENNLSDREKRAAFFAKKFGSN